jgi:chromosome segregation ATPase
MPGKLTVTEAAAMIGKSERTLYRYINQGKIKSNKIIENGKEIVNIPMSELERIAAETKKISEVTTAEKDNISKTPSDKSAENSGVGEYHKTGRTEPPGAETAEILKSGNMVILPVDLYNKEKEEREKYFQGMMMYRFKYEELESKLKLLPAPAEVISHEFEKIRMDLDDKEKTLQVKEKELSEQLSANEAKEQALKDTGSRLQSVSGRLEQSESEIHSLENTLKAEREELERLRKEKEALSGELTGQREEEAKAREAAERLEREKNEAEEKLAKERADLKELLRKKEVERRETEDLLKIEKSRSWWKKLLGMK